MVDTSRLVQQCPGCDEYHTPFCDSDEVDYNGDSRAIKEAEREKSNKKRRTE